jgi:hypothetical protein
LGKPVTNGRLHTWKHGWYWIVLLERKQIYLNSNREFFPPSWEYIKCMTVMQS